MTGRTTKSKQKPSDLEGFNISILREDLRRKAKTDLFSFMHYVNLDYQANWHHKLISKEIQDFWEHPTQNRLMLFVPPQHGKSEIASRLFPSYVLGTSPNTKIAAASYSIDLARSFNRDIQRVLEGDFYEDVFPNTNLNSKNVSADSKGTYLRNTEEFEVVNHKGSYKAVGVLGGLSGRAVDLAIIDDPVKDAIEASSLVYRERTWQWYLNVLSTRLHNKSKVLLIMTRWHEDDLAGRLLSREPKKWKVIKIPAILESEEDRYNGDPRKIGDSLWPKKHSLQKLNDLRALSETVFQSLYQQNPFTPGGNKVKTEWFQYCDSHQAPKDIVYDMWIDGAYTKSTKNDPTGFLIAGYSKKQKALYIKHASSEYMEMPSLLHHVPIYFKEQGLTIRSRVIIEPKASGKSLKQMITSNTNLSAIEIKSRLVSEGKTARLSVFAPKVEGGKVVLIKGLWNDHFVTQICAFPNATHDEYIDLMGYACERYFATKRIGVRRRN